jgi:large subunit ribosomal protein L32e
MMAETKESGIEKKEVAKQDPIKAKDKKTVAAKPKATTEKKELKKEAIKKEVKKEKPSYKVSRSTEAKKKANEKIRVEKKKRNFKRQNLGKKLRVPDRWRRSRGIDSGQAKEEKDKPSVPKVGYMTPKPVRGLHPTGYTPIRVFNVSGLESVNKKTEAIMIASAVGMKKRLDIQKKADEMGIAILNFKT